MKLSSIEITEREYLIKLNKEEFDLNFIKQLLKRMQSEILFPSFTESPCDEDIKSKNGAFEYGFYFSHLDDK